MGCDPVEEKDIVIDIGSCVYKSTELEIPNLSNEEKESVVLQRSVDEPHMKGNIGDSAIFLSNMKCVGGADPYSIKNVKKEKCKSTSAKKPPRPPRGFSLDLADQKLIKEIAELAMVKRARIERMKALKRMKATKASSVSTSSSGNVIAMLFTILFCIVMIFQGCHSIGISSGNSSVTGIPSSMESGGATDGNLLLVQETWNLSTSSAPLTGPGSPNLIESIPSSDRQGY